MSNAYFVVAPSGESQGSFLNPKVPDNSRIVEATVGSAAYNAWLGNGSYNGYQVVMGPFSTAAQAKAAHPPAGLSAVITAAGLGAKTVGNRLANVTGPPGSSPDQTAAGGFHLVFGHTGGLLGRILKVGFGGILIVAGVMIMFPKVNQDTLGVVTKVAGKVPLV